jgi:hypothetical protein
MMVGVGLAVIAAFAGDHDHSIESHVDADHSAEHTGDHMWLPFLSLRFWTYGLAGFGLTGFLLTLFTGTVASTVLGLALAMGAICGLMVATIVRLAQKQESTSGVGTKEMLGLEANVLVSIRPGQSGKVRFQAKGDIIDMIAISDEDATIEMGTKALVVGIEGDRARVIALDAFEGENLLARS